MTYFWSNCNFGALSQKTRENVEKEWEFDVVTKNSRQFGDFFRISNLDRQNWPKIRQFDVVFRVNSSVSFNHEKFSISFQFDEFFRIFWRVFWSISAGNRRFRRFVRLFWHRVPVVYNWVVWWSFYWDILLGHSNLSLKCREMPLWEAQKPNFEFL